MSWLLALAWERWRRWWLLAILGVLFGLGFRQLPEALAVKAVVGLVGLLGYVSLTEGLDAWLSEKRMGRLSYYRAWGLRPECVALNLSLAMLPPVVLIIGLAVSLEAHYEVLFQQLAAGFLTAFVGLGMAAVLWRICDARPWLKRLLPLGLAFLSASIAQLILQ